MQIIVKKERGNNLTLIFTISKDDQNEAHVVYPFLGTFPAMARIKISKGVLNVSIKKHFVSKGNVVKVNVKCERLGLFSQLLTCRVFYSEWMSMGKLPYKDSDFNNGKTKVFEIKMSAIEVKKLKFVPLYHEDDFCNVLLITDDGSAAGVQLHKVVLGAHSPMFREKLLDKLRESPRMRIWIKGFTLLTLQHLKDFMYLGILPDQILHLQALLLIGKHYHFDNLLTETVFKLCSTTRPENLLTLRQFGVNTQIPELVDALMRIIPDEVVHRPQKEKKLKSPQKKSP